MFLDCSPSVLGIAKSQYKRCTKCGEFKPATLDYFALDRGTLHAYCRSCVTAKSVAWNKANKDRRREITKRWYEANKEQHSAAVAKWRKSNKELVAAWQKAWKKSHPEQIKTKNHRRRARKLKLNDSFTASDWQFALDYFGGCCAVCGRPPGLWHVLAADHWIPITSPKCPGTVPYNMVPMCHDRKGGVGGCNNSKNNHDPIEWITRKYGKRKGRVILKRIEAFLDGRRN